MILVQELRDRETAELAMQAAEHGSLVLSMVHAFDSTAVVMRLSDLAIDGARIGSVQRLVRRLCEKCQQPWTPSPGDSRAVGFEALFAWHCRHDDARGNPSQHATGRLDFYHG